VREALRQDAVTMAAPAAKDEDGSEALVTGSGLRGGKIDADDNGEGAGADGQEVKGFVRLPDKVTYTKVRDKRTLGIKCVKETHKFTYNAFSASRSPYWEDQTATAADGGRGRASVVGRGGLVQRMEVRHATAPRNGGVMLAEGQETPRTEQEGTREFYVEEKKANGKNLQDEGEQESDGELWDSD
jgi:hypothetical protein